MILFYFISILVSTLLFFIIWKFKSTNRQNFVGKLNTIIFLGSGGHTAEMISLLRCLPCHFSPRTYIYCENDLLSLEKATKLEKNDIDNSYITIPRARKVKQPYFTSIFTTFWALIYACYLMFVIQPNLLLCNGPGTCVPLCISFILMKYYRWLRLSKTKHYIVYIESMSRTFDLSLTGKIIYYLNLANVIVQWPELKIRYPHAQYIGLLT